MTGLRFGVGGGGDFVPGAYIPKGLILGVLIPQGIVDPAVAFIPQNIDSWAFYPRAIHPKMNRLYIYDENPIGIN